MKKVLAVLMVLVMVFSLTACGGGLSTGKYKLTSYKLGDTDLAALLGDEAGNMYIEIVDGENAKLCLGDDDVAECKYDGSYFFSGDEKMGYKTSGNKIIISEEADGMTVEMIFEK